MAAEGGGGHGEDIIDPEIDEELEDSEEEEDLLYYGPPPIPLKLYNGKITDWFHPFDVHFVYFTRLDRGPIGEPASLETAEAEMSRVCYLKLLFCSHGRCFSPLHFAGFSRTIFSP